MFGRERAAASAPLLRVPPDKGGGAQDKRTAHRAGPLVRTGDRLLACKLLVLATDSKEEVELLLLMDGDEALSRARIRSRRVGCASTAAVAPGGGSAGFSQDGMGRSILRNADFAEAREASPTEATEDGELLLLHPGEASCSRMRMRSRRVGCASAAAADRGCSVIGFSRAGPVRLGRSDDAADGRLRSANRSKGRTRAPSRELEGATIAVAG